MMNNETKISDLTLGQLFEAIDEYLAELSSPSRTIDGVKGLAEYLGCSVRTAQRIKSSGKIDRAVTQSDRTIMINEAELRKILRPKTNNKIHEHYEHR